MEMGSFGLGTVGGSAAHWSLPHFRGREDPTMHR